MAETVREILTRSYDPDPRVRRQAVRDLCPCQVKRKDLEAWTRVFELTRDPEIVVRKNAFHGIIDGLPAELTDEAAAVLEAMRDDPEPKLRRQVRNVLSRYRRTGRIGES